MTVVHDLERELSSALGSVREHDEASAPAFREVLAAARSRRASEVPRFRLWIAAMALVPLALALAFFSRRPLPQPQVSVIADQIARWKPSTGSLLHTPGIELWRSTPDWVPPVPDYRQWTPAAPAVPTRERTPRGRLSSHRAADLIGSLPQKGVEG